MTQKKSTFWITLVLATSLLVSLTLNGALFYGLLNGMENLFAWNEFNQIQYLQSNANHYKEIRDDIENGGIEVAKDRLDRLYRSEISALRFFGESERKQTSYAAIAAIKRIEEKRGPVD